MSAPDAANRQNTRHSIIASSDPRGREDEYNSFGWAGSENPPEWGAGWGMRKKAESRQDRRMESVKFSNSNVGYLPK